MHQLSYSQYPELAELLVIPSLPVEKAKLLYEADLTSPALIVDADEGKDLFFWKYKRKICFVRYDTKSIKRKASYFKETDFDFEDECEKYNSGMIEIFS